MGLMAISTFLRALTLQARSFHEHLRNLGDLQRLSNMILPVVSNYHATKVSPTRAP